MVSMYVSTAVTCRAQRPDTAVLVIAMTWARERAHTQSTGKQDKAIHSFRVPWLTSRHATHMLRPRWPQPRLTAHSIKRSHTS